MVYETENESELFEQENEFLAQIIKLYRLVLTNLANTAFSVTVCD